MAVTKKIILQYCVGCHREINADKFNSSKNPNHTSGYLPYCKDCMRKMFDANLSKSGSIAQAIFWTAGELGVPIIEEIYNRYNEECSVRNIKPSFAGYYNKLANQNIVRFDDLKFSRTDMDVASLVGIIPNQKAISVELEQLEFDWGRRSERDYQFLVPLFNKLTKDVDFENPTHEYLYRQLCISMLEVRKIEEGESTDDLKNARAMMLNFASKLKIDDFTSNKPKTLSEQSLFELITKVDEHNVQELYSTPYKFADFNKRKEQITKFSYRPLGNTVAGMRDFDISLEDMENYEERLKLRYEGLDDE